MHVVPLRDLIDHDTSGADCICGPTTTAVFRDDGTNGWLTHHASLDGREAVEQATGRGTGRTWWFGYEGETPK